VSLVIQTFYFKVAEISFYINRVGFVPQSQINSQDYQKWSVMDNETTNPGWKEMSLYYIEDL
jgi:hypothetical protein